MRTADFDFDLPPELIAQEPATHRDQSRLLVLERKSGRMVHRQFGELFEYLRAGDVLVLNNSRVIPARLRGRNARTGGQFELLLLEENATNDWWAMLRPGKRAPVGAQIIISDAQGLPTSIIATVVETNAAGHRRLGFVGVTEIADLLERLGEIPLPPYIRRSGTGQADRERYQTVFAKPPGSVAAPTAGLHFTEALLEKIRSLGVKICYVTLHVGLGTFAPVKTTSLAAHTMHEERFEVSEETAAIISHAKHEGRRIIAIGTTTLRVLESAVNSHRIESKEGQTASPPALVPHSGKTRIFIYPPYEFKLADVLVTNFHLPCSTLIMLVSAFAAPNQTRGRDLILAAYAEAIRERYRFFSYGDAMLIV